MQNPRLAREPGDSGEQDADRPNWRTVLSGSLGGPKLGIDVLLAFLAGNAANQWGWSAAAVACTAIVILMAAYFVRKAFPEGQRARVLIPTLWLTGSFACLVAYAFLLDARPRLTTWFLFLAVALCAGATLTLVQVRDRLSAVFAIGLISVGIFTTWLGFDFLASNDASSGASFIATGAIIVAFAIRSWFRGHLLSGVAGTALGFLGVAVGVHFSISGDASVGIGIVALFAGIAMLGIAAGHGSNRLFAWLIVFGGSVVALMGALSANRGHLVLGLAAVLVGVSDISAGIASASGSLKTFGIASYSGGMAFLLVGIYLLLNDLPLPGVGSLLIGAAACSIGFLTVPVRDRLARVMEWMREAV